MRRLHKEQLWVDYKIANCARQKIARRDVVGIEHHDQFTIQPLQRGGHVPGLRIEVLRAG